MMGLDLIFILVIVSAIAYARGWRPEFNQTRPAKTSQSPEEILKARYAAGEITHEEYEQARRDLEG